MMVFSKKFFVLTLSIVGFAFFSSFNKNSQSYGEESAKEVSTSTLDMSTKVAPAKTAALKLAVQGAVQVAQALLGSVDSKELIVLNQNVKLSNLD